MPYPYSCSCRALFRTPKNVLKHFSSKSHLDSEKKTNQVIHMIYNDL